MTLAWQSEDYPETAPHGVAGWLRFGVRGTALALVIFGGLAALLAIRLVERPLFGLRRPLTPYVTQAVCRAALAILGLRRNVFGEPLRAGGAIVANHASWLDIFVLNAGQRVYFVSKAEVRTWPGIGWLARATGTVFIDRTAREARAHRDLVAERVTAGHTLLIFPEGTSTDGRRVLPFRSTLFDAFFGVPEAAAEIQPVTVVYHAPAGEDPRFYGWWGGMDYGGHLAKMLAARRHGSVDVIYHPPLKVAEQPDRKALARRAGDIVRAELERRLAATAPSG
jgi:1-acyl-sn-glycerol-3-phosphate acyltransferase